MAASQSTISHESTITLHSAATSLAAPSLSSDGADITALRRGRFAPRDSIVTIDATGTVSLTDAYICGYDANDAKWRALAKLNQGDTIALTATIGYAEKVFDVACFSRVAVMGTFTGTLTVRLKPVENLD
jgi:hypothetical protein